MFVITAHLGSPPLHFRCHHRDSVQILCVVWLCVASLLRLSSVARASLTSASARVVLRVRVVSLASLPPRIFLFLFIFFKNRYCAYGFISQSITLVDPLSAHNAFADITLWKCEKDTQTGLHAFLLLKQLNQVKYIKFEGSEVGFFSKTSFNIVLTT
ncbi:hypothetical protein AHAS_Ahas01G0132500 [Arachis hypogaea]